MLHGLVPYTLSLEIALVDAFLGIVAIVELFGFMAMASFLTKRIDFLAADCITAIQKFNVPVSKFAPVFQYLQTAGRKTGTGYKVMGIRVGSKHVGFLLS